MSEKKSTEELLKDIKERKVPREVQLLAARGTLPFSQEELLPILVSFLSIDDKELSSLSRKTLLDFPRHLLIDYIKEEKCTQEELDLLVYSIEDDSILSAIAGSKNLKDSTLVFLAMNGSELVQEIIITNQARILSNPKILDALEKNHKLSPSIKRRIIEIKEEFFAVKKKFVPTITEEETKEMGITEQEYMDLFESFHIENLSEDQLFSTINLPAEPQSEEQMSILVQILKMTVPEKIQLALKGGQEARGILICDSSKLVREAVVKSPKITEQEICAVASNRSIDEDILRYIGTNRKFIRKYPIIKNLCFNPKTPVGVSLNLLNRLTKKDLRDLSSEKNVPDTVQKMALRLFKMRLERTS